MELIKRRPLISFFVLAYLISWVLWTPLLFADTEPGAYYTILLILGGLGPLLSATFLSMVTETTGAFKRTLFKWKVNVRWYAVALILPIIAVLVAYSLYLLIGGVPMNPADAPPVYAYPLLLLFVMSLGGGLEEPGWRGFALPRLCEQRSPFVSSLTLGVIWILWHLPLFFAPSSSQAGLPFGWYVANGLAISFVFTWLFLRSERSIVLAIVLHGGINAALSWYPLGSDIQTSIGTVSFFAPIALVSWLLVILILIFDRKAFFLEK